jgi:hypothetical protein
MRDGRSPSVEKRRAAILANAAAGNTFAVVAEEFVAKLEAEGLAATTSAKLSWYLSLLGAPFGRRPIAEIEAFELLDALRKIEAGGRYETANSRAGCSVTPSPQDGRRGTWPPISKGRSPPPRSSTTPPSLTQGRRTAHARYGCL